jgi:hypothetical protein
MQVLEDNKRKTNMIQRHQKDQETAENAYKSEAAERNRVCTQFCFFYTCQIALGKKTWGDYYFLTRFGTLQFIFSGGFFNDLSSHGDNFV